MFIQQRGQVMKKLVGVFSAAAAALAFGPLAAGAPQGPLQSAPITVVSPILEDDMDGDEDTGVVDPVPQDDGSPGIDDPCAPQSN